MPTWKESHTTMLWGIAIGFVLTMIVGFNYGDWSTAGSVRKAVETAEWNALIPVCADAVFADPAAQADLNTKKPSDYDDVVRDHLKAVAGRTISDYQFRRDCGKAIAEKMLKAAVKK